MKTVNWRDASIIAEMLMMAGKPSEARKKQGRISL